MRFLAAAPQLRPCLGPSKRHASTAGDVLGALAFGEQAGVEQPLVMKALDHADEDWDFYIAVG